MFKKHTKAISIVLTIAMIATMICVAAVSVAAADPYLVCGTIPGASWDVTATTAMTEVDGVWTATFENVEPGSYEYKVTKTWADDDTWNEDGLAVGVNSNSKIEVTETSNVIITFNGSNTASQVVPATVDPTETTDEPTEVTTAVVTDPATETTTAVVTDPATDPATEVTTAPATEGDSALINGVSAVKGDIITYTFNLTADKALENIQAVVNYDGSALKLVDATKKELFPVIAEVGGLVYNTGLDNMVKFNASDIGDGYDFTNGGVLFQAKFEVLQNVETNISLTIEEMNANGYTYAANGEFVNAFTSNNAVVNDVQPTTAEPTTVEPTTVEPTTVEPTTVEPTEATTAEPTEATTAEPTEATTAEPTEATTAEPTEATTADTTAEPTEATTAEPTEATTAEPTEATTADTTAAGTTVAPTDENGSTVVPTTTPNATSGEDNGNNTVQTGDATSAVVLLLVLVSAAGAVYFVRRKVNG